MNNKTKQKIKRELNKVICRNCGDDFLSYLPERYTNYLCLECKSRLDKKENDGLLQQYKETENGLVEVEPVKLKDRINSYSLDNTILDTALNKEVVKQISDDYGQIMHQLRETQELMTRYGIKPPQPEVKQSPDLAKEGITNSDTTGGAGVATDKGGNIE